MKPELSKTIKSFLREAEEIELEEHDACIHTETWTRSWMVNGRPVTVSCVRIALVGAPLPENDEELGLIADKVGIEAGELLADSLFDWQENGAMIARDLGFDNPPSNN